MRWDQGDLVPGPVEDCQPDGQLDPHHVAERLDRRGFCASLSVTQCSDASDGNRLVVEVGGEVSYLFDGMRQAMDPATCIVIGRLGRCIEPGKADGSMTAEAEDVVLVKPSTSCGWPHR